MINVLQLLYLVLLVIDMPVIFIICYKPAFFVKLKHTCIIAVLITLCTIMIYIITLNSKYQEVFTKYYDVVENNGRYDYVEKSGSSNIKHLENNDTQNLRIYKSGKSTIMYGTGLSEMQEVITRYTWYIFYVDKSSYTVYLP